MAWIVQLSRAAENDLSIKARQADKFILEGHQVEINMRLRGREKYNKEWARGRLEEFAKMITAEHKRISERKFGGWGLFMLIAKK